MGPYITETNKIKISFLESGVYFSISDNTVNLRFEINESFSSLSLTCDKNFNYSCFANSRIVMTKKFGVTKIFVYLFITWKDLWEQIGDDANNKREVNVLDIK